MQIRQATAEDEMAILALARDFATSFQVDPGAFHNAFHALMSQADASILVAQEGSGVVGYLLGFDHLGFFANGRVAWVEEITVQAELRGQGIGRQLMDHFESRAKSRGATLVALATRRAKAFYLALGYEESAAYFRKLL